MKLRLLILPLLLAVPAALHADTLHDRALGMLRRLNAAAATCLHTDPADPDRGALGCPGCGLCHTRSAEALFPFAVEYAFTGNRTRLAQAVGLGEWLLRQQGDQGEWQETPESWTGTTTDQLLMLALAYPLVSAELTSGQRTRWLHGMERAADYLTRVMDNRFASINYCATTTATLAEVHRLVPKASYAAKARSLARMIVSKMNAEGFIEGEGGREGDYKYGVDIGYNLEMSLWGLARYARLTADTLVDAAVRRSAEQHLWFIYPDGMLDASAGVRSNKWTLWGSGTSDGCHPLCALLCGENPAFAEAAVRNIDFLGHSFTSSGLLGTGPDYDRVRKTPPCIYPTFTKAKSLAMALVWQSAEVTAATLPTDCDTCRRFATLGTTVVRRGPFCGTVTASTYKAREGAASKYMHRPAGGVSSALWIENFGLLQASSQTEYHRWEPMSFPEMPALSPLTPRIECGTVENYFTNLYEFDAWSETRDETAAVRCTAGGLLRDRNGRPCGIGYVLTHRFEGRRLVKEYEVFHHTADDTVRIVEPILTGGDTRIERLDSRSLRIIRPGRSLTIRLAGDAAVLRIDSAAAPRYRSVYPALVALPLVADVPVREPFRRERVEIIIETEPEP